MVFTLLILSSNISSIYQVIYIQIYTTTVYTGTVLVGFIYSSQDPWKNFGILGMDCLAEQKLFCLFAFVSE